MPAELVAGALPSLEEVLTLMIFIFSCFADAGGRGRALPPGSAPRSPGERGRGSSPVSPPPPGPRVPLTGMWLLVPGKAQPAVTEVKSLFWTERVYRAELKVNRLFAVRVWSLAPHSSPPGPSRAALVTSAGFQGRAKHKQLQTAPACWAPLRLPCAAGRTFGELLPQLLCHAGKREGRKMPNKMGSPG